MSFNGGVLGRFFALLRMTETNNTLAPCGKERHVEAVPKHRMAGKLEKFNFLKNKNSESVVNTELTNQLDSFATAQNDHNNNSLTKRVCDSFTDTVFSRFTKPSRGISEAKVEPQSTETLSFRCWSERCRLMRGAVNNQNSKVAFTLAEVLITLGIIGVVAALTLPALIQNCRERAFVTAAKKNYSILTNAVNQWSANNGSIGDPTLFWLANESNYAALQELGKELNAVKICDYSEIRNCGGGYDVLQYKRVNNGRGNTAEENWVSSYPRIILADGTFVSLSREAVRSGSCEENAWANDKDENGNYIKDETSPSGFKGHYYTNTVCGRIAFDTNGLKGPNQIGVDVFELAYYGNGRVGGNSDGWGNIDYVLKNDRLIKTEKYTPGKF